MTEKSKPETEIDEPSGVETTGHEWDGIKELNNPLPRWWLWTFYATIVFALGYVLYYPAIPLLEASTMGISGQTNRSILKAELAEVDRGRHDKVQLLVDTGLEEIRSNEDLARFATAGGASIFKVYCTQCHGSGAAGGPGYPNLNDDDWLWGGDLASIYTSIKHGIRNGEDEDARDSVMPAFGVDGILTRPQIAAVTEHVLKISNQEHDAKLAVEGEAIYAENCASCHLEDGLGNRELGAPNLADAISLYGNTRPTIQAQIWKPQQGVMPAWADKLSDANIKQLSVYVHGLGGGERAKAEN